MAQPLNDPVLVERWSNRLNLLQKWEGKVVIPPFTQDTLIAIEWLKKGRKIVGRSLKQYLPENSGCLLHSYVELSLFTYPFYTQYVPKRREYQVYILGGRVFDIKSRVSSSTFHNKNPFQQPDEEIPTQVLSNAEVAMELTGLNFGVVNVIWNSFLKEAYVLSIKTGLKRVDPQDRTKISKSTQPGTDFVWDVVPQAIDQFPVVNPIFQPNDDGLLYVVDGDEEDEDEDDE